MGQTATGSDLYVIDAFAGPGTFPDGADMRGWSEGSPLIACNAAAYAQQWFAGRGRHVRVHVRCVERRPATSRVLANALTPFAGRVDYQVTNGTAESRLPTFLEESIGHPTLILLDPDGFRQLSMDLVRPCARDFTEVLISFDVQGAIRTAGLRDASSVTALYGDDMWRLLRGADGSIDVRAFLEGYRVRLGKVFRYTSVKRIVYTAEHANRVIVQGCGSELGVREWRASFEEAKRPDGVEVFDFVADVDEQTKIDAAIASLRTLAGQTVNYGRIVQVLGGLELDEERTHQALLFLQEVGQVTWTSFLHRKAKPAPRFTFAPDMPERMKWDGVRRQRESSAAREAPPA